MKKFIIIFILTFCTQLSSYADYSNFYCDSGFVYCGEKLEAYCSDYSFAPKCLNRIDLAGTYTISSPVCCKKIDNALICKSTLLTCPNTGVINGVNVGVASGPKLPSIDTFSLSTDETLNGSYKVFPGSTPTLELDLPRKLDREVLSVQIRSSDGIIHNNIQYTIKQVETVDEKILLTLTIPEDVSIGGAKVSIKLSDGQDLIFWLEILNPIFYKESNIKNPSKPIPDPGLPKVTSATIKGGRKYLRLYLKGNNLPANKVFYLSNNEVIKEENDKFDPFTSSIVLPRSLGINVVKTKMSKTSTNIEIPLQLTKQIPGGKQDVIIVVSTPRGIVSIPKTILTRTTDPNQKNGIYCNKNKAICPEGKTAKCTKGYEVNCQKGFPECCYKLKHNKGLICKTKRLYCPN